MELRQLAGPPSQTAGCGPWSRWGKFERLPHQLVYRDTTTAEASYGLRPPQRYRTTSATCRPVAFSSGQTRCLSSRIDIRARCPKKRFLGIKEVLLRNSDSRPS